MHDPPNIHFATRNTARCRFIVDPPRDGVWNMAADEFLLRTAAERALPTLRIYQWSHATLSLGYFQPAAARREHAPSAACPWVRRATGGGAIVHDKEITYSIAMAVADRWSAGAQRLYDVVHQSVVDYLAHQGVQAQLWRERSEPEERHQPFLCFQRRAAGDVVCGDHKVVGSAQRRRHGAILQHGSILLAVSEAAPELPGLQQLAPGSGDPASWIAGWPQRLAKHLHWELVPSDWQADEQEHVDSVDCKKFRSKAWNLRR